MKEQYNISLILQHLVILVNVNLQPQIRKSWDSMENANKKRK